MKLINFKKIALFLIISLFSTLQAAPLPSQQELLKTQNVDEIMEQIFAHHVEKKEMTQDILKHSFQVYIDQFDPDRLYLLQSEVAPFLNPSEQTLKANISLYQQANFTPFNQINDVIQKAILRAREWRKGLEGQQSTLFTQAKKNHMTHGSIFEDHMRSFATSPQELQSRWQDQGVSFIQSQISRFGDSAVQQHSSRMIALFENNLINRENQYLYLKEDGSPVAPEEKEHLFTLHILKALAKSLDAHTSFFDSAEAYDMKVRLEKGYEGIGIIFQEGVDGVYVVNLIKGSPADRSNQIKVQDKLVSIDGIPVQNEPFSKIMERIRGPENTSIQLVLKRTDAQGNENPFTIELKRESITVDQDRVEITTESYGDGIIGKITLHSFYQNPNGISSENDVRAAVEKLKQQGKLRGLILDLRDNSGGYLSQAVKVAGLFITNGVIVISKYSNGEEKIFRDLDSRVIFDGPMVVLTSKLTASAAEIVAQALQDYGVAVIVGDDRTYGKGSIQTQTVTGNQSTSLFKVTVGKYYTVSGKTPQTQGVKADVIVPSRFMHENIGEEFLEYPLAADKVAAEYEDTLSDIVPQNKGWFLRYYLPSLQHKKNNFEQMVPTLKKNSEWRIAHNKNYQFFLKQNGDKTAKVEETDEDLLGESPLKNYGSADLSLDEAVNVVKDMVILESAFDNRFVGKRE